MKDEFHTLLILNSGSMDVFTCESKFIPRVGDQLPFSYFPFPTVKSVCLNINSPKNVLLEETRKQMPGLIEKVGFEWNAIEAVVTIE